MYPRLSRSTLFPYTTLFRSLGNEHLETFSGRRKSLPGWAQAESVRNEVFRAGDSIAPSMDTTRGLSMETTPSNRGLDRKSTRLNSSHLGISYAVFCLKKKKI